jgi:hypothetical protein
MAKKTEISFYGLYQGHTASLHVFDDNIVICYYKSKERIEVKYLDVESQIKREIGFYKNYGVTLKTSTQQHFFGDLTEKEATKLKKSIDENRENFRQRRINSQPRNIINAQLSSNALSLGSSSISSSSMDSFSSSSLIDILDSSYHKGKLAVVSRSSNNTVPDFAELTIFPRAIVFQV